MATFTLQVPDDLIPRLNDAGRLYMMEHYGVDTDMEGWAPIEVMRELTRRQWGDALTEFDVEGSRQGILDGVSGEVGGIT